MLQRTFLASFGLDTKNGQPATSCRSFAAALAPTNAGGEIIMLDSAGYGPVSINKSVSIIARLPASRSLRPMGNVVNTLTGRGPMRA